MANKKGFTLIELVIVLVIVGIILAIVLPHIMSYVEQEKAQTAANNLLTIGAAESKYYEDNNNGYFYSMVSSTLLSTLSVIQTPNDNFSYTCSASGASFSCNATDAMGTSLTLNPTVAHPLICTPSNLCPANLPSS